MSTYYVKYQEITTNATTVLKAGPGKFRGFVVNNAGSSWNIQIWDAVTTTGTALSSAKVAIVGSTKLAVPAAGSTLIYECTFSQGLVIITSDGTPGSITALYY